MSAKLIHHSPIPAEANLHRRLSPNGAAVAKIAMQCEKTNGIGRHYG